MKLNRREIILLSLLLVIALVFGLYRFVYTPFMAKVTAMNAELQSVTGKADTIRTELMTKKAFEKRFEAAKASILELQTPFFSSLTPETFILQTRDFLLTSGMTPSMYTISPVSAETIVVPASDFQAIDYALADLARQYRELTAPTSAATPTPTPEPSNDAGGTSAAIEVLRIGVTATGSYNQVQSFLAQIETLNRKIVVDELSLTVNPDLTLTVNLSMYYVGLEKMFPQTGDPFDAWVRPDVTPAPTPGIFPVVVAP